MKSKQKIVSIIIAFIILLFANISLATNTATIKVETARLRESPSQNASILDLISVNEEVEILSQEGDWYKVKYNGITGYLRNDLLKLANQNIDNTNTETNEGNTENTAETNNEITGGNVTDQIDNQVTQNTNNNTNTANETASNEVDNNVQDEEKMQEAESDIAGKYIVSKDTNLKIVPLINALNVGTLQANNEVEILELINKWAYVNNETIQGWIRYDSLTKVEQGMTEQNQEQNTTAQPEEQQEPETEESATKIKYVNTQTVNVRKEASTSASIVTQITINTEVEVLSEESGWYKVKVNGVEGYIATTLLSDTKQETSRGATEFRDTDNKIDSEQTETSANNSNDQQNDDKKEENSNNVTSSDSATSSSNTGASVLAFAKQYLGYPYVYGGASPSGFDCSGFTSYVYKHFGVSLSRTAAGQASNGVAVKRSELQVGDLVMFCTPINHVGIYAGNNQIIHAANKTRGVVIDTISSGYYNTNYNCARRIF